MDLNNLECFFNYVNKELKNWNFYLLNFVELIIDIKFDKNECCNEFIVLVLFCFIKGRV